MTECIEFPGRKDTYGYGRLTYMGKEIPAHRLAFFRLHSWWPPVVRHTCDNPPCWNQTHLIAGTKADNTRDMMERGRAVYPTGTRNGRTKLTDHDVIGIRLLVESGWTRKAVAMEFGVTAQHVGHLARRLRRQIVQ